MSKSNLEQLDDWCRQACGHIRFEPDASKVEKELRSHMEDHYDVLVSSGMDEDVAVLKTVDTMGDPDVVGQALDKLYNPTIGWAWFFSVLALVCLLVMVPFSIASQNWDTDGHPMQFIHEPDIWPFTQTEHGTSHRTLLVEPDAAAQVGDYTFHIDQASIWESNSGEKTLYFRLDASHLPWVPELNGTGVSRHFTITYDQGKQWIVGSNSYPGDSSYYYSYSYDGAYYFPTHYDPLTDTFVIKVSGFDGSEWFDLNYDWGDYQFTLHVDLTGGDAL